VRRKVAAIALLMVFACKHDHPHEGDQAHGPGTEEERPGLSATVWTDKTELFVEYPALVVGIESAFAAHLTDLSSFKAVAEGTVTLTLRTADGSMTKADVNGPLGPGIFRPVLKPSKPGRCTLTLAVRSAKISEEISIASCEVHPTLAAAKAVATPEAPPGRISYLKEQQWKTDFATTPVIERDLQPSTRVNGEIRPVAGKEARLSAPAPGRVIFPAVPPVLGMTVKKGQVLLTLAPRLSGGGDRATLQADTLSAQAELAAAEAQAARAERLFADQAVPQKTVEEARTNVKVAQARLGAAQGRSAQYTASAGGGGGSGRATLQIRSPLDGTVVDVSVSGEETVDEGRSLVTVMNLAKVWLEARVFEPDIPKVEGARAGWFTLEGYETPFSFDAKIAKLVTVGRVIDPQTRTVPIIFELNNVDGRFRVGQLAKINLVTGSPTRSLAIPESAIVEEAGKPFAYVQVQGESFERRSLVTGVQGLGWIAVKDGVTAGERVVSKGAYEVKLASASGNIPAHGHAH
jgi:membrane fusion protein, heavy metal efflux system